jgi:hypothetical protein
MRMYVYSILTYNELDQSLTASLRASVPESIDF